MNDEEDVRVLRPLDEPMVSPEIKLYIDRLVDQKIKEHILDIDEKKQELFSDITEVLETHKELILSMLTELLVVVSHVNNIATAFASAHYQHNDDLYHYSEVMLDAVSNTPSNTASERFLQDVQDLLAQLQFYEDKFDNDIDALWKRVRNSRGAYLNAHTNPFTEY